MAEFTDVVDAIKKHFMPEGRKLLGEPDVRRNGSWVYVNFRPDELLSVLPISDIASEFTPISKIWYGKNADAGSFIAMSGRLQGQNVELTFHV